MSTEITQDLVTVTIDGKEIKARNGELLIAAAEDAGIFIPRFCYHPRLPQVGMCRMCLVEVKGPRGYSLQPSCYVPVSQGMEVVTSSDKVKKAQDGVLEFLLINHPLDCPVCDKGGECPLQDQTLAYGPGESRFGEEKRHFEKPIAISDLVFLDRERCIQCDRCTRFADVVAGDPLIEFIGRGDNTEVNVFPDKPFSSYFSGNTVQICPVGALTASPYRFKARPWDLSQTDSSCMTCSMGCRIMVQSSQNELTRFIGLDSDSVNQSWLCDKGRFGHEAIISQDRLTTPLVRQGGELVETTWADAMSVIGEKLRDLRSTNRADKVGVLLGSRLSNEDIYAWVKLAKSVIGTDSIDSNLGNGISSSVIARLPRATINEALGSKAILAFTGDIKEEIPVLYLRLREAVNAGKVKIAQLRTRTSSLDSLCEVSAVPTPENLRSLARGLLRGSTSFPELSDFMRTNSVGEDGEGLVVLLGRENLAWHSGVAENFALEILKTAPKTKFLICSRESNFMGIADLGAAPGLLPGRRLLSDPSTNLLNKWDSVPGNLGRSASEMLESAINDELELLFLVGSDPRGDYCDAKFANAAVDKTNYVVSIDTFLNQSSSQADLILPAAAFAEKSGSTTNLEGRVLPLNQKVTAPGLCRTDWEIACEIASMLDHDLGFSSDSEILDEISAISNLHWGLSRERLTRYGVLEGILLPIVPSQISITVKHPFDQISTPGIASVWNQGLASSKVDYVERNFEVKGDDSNKQMVQDSLPPIEPSWPSYPFLPSGYLELAYLQKLYSPGEQLKNSPHLSHLAVESKCKVSPKTAGSIGVDSGGYVKLTDGYGNSTTIEVEVASQVRDNVVEIVKGVFADFSFSPIKHGESVNYIKVERA